MKRHVAAIAISLSSLSLAASATAHADQSARCSLRSIHASPSPGGVDDKLADLKQQLLRAPFSDWKSFKLLGDAQLTLEPGKSGAAELPEGRTATLTYKEHLSPDGGKHRVRLQLQVMRGTTSQLSTVFVLDEGGTVLTTSKLGDGMLILGVRCSIDS